MYALYLDSMSRVDEGMAQHKRALELDPLSLITSTNLGELLFDTRHTDQAIEQYRKTLDIDPSFTPVHKELGDAYGSKGMYREAVAEWQKGLIAEGDSTTAEAIGQAYSKSGHKGALRTWVEHLTSPSNHGYIPPAFIASIYARLGENDRAFEWLEKAYQERDSDLVFLKVEPVWDNLRPDPRYPELLRWIGLQP
jgi:tetratricopeptide (TPR) repeat protein